MEYLIQFSPLILMLLFMYFFLIKPEKKRKMEYANMLNMVEVNDEVLTKGGIIGKVIKIQDDFVIVESGPDRVRMKMVKDAILTNLTKSKVTTEVAPATEVKEDEAK